jgi:hypothetical protein
MEASELKLGWFPAKLIADKSLVKKRRIREGDEMFFVGLFTPFFGDHENIPICRFGRLAMLTDEKIPWGSEGAQNLYLMETGAFGGNSGSPVFFYFRNNRAPRFLATSPTAHHGPLLLAGVVKGYFRDWSQVMQTNSAVIEMSAQNMGVAAVVPAYYLHEILFSPEEKKFRSESFKALVRTGYN